MSTTDLLQQFQHESEIEIAALTARCDAIDNEKLQVKAELTQLRSTISRMLHTAQEHVEEYRDRAHAAVHSEIALKAQIVTLQDELTCAAQLMQDHAARLFIPELVLQEHGYSVRGVNPLREVQTIRKELQTKVKALTRKQVKSVR